MLETKLPAEDRAPRFFSQHAVDRAHGRPMTPSDRRPGLKASLSLLARSLLTLSKHHHRSDYPLRPSHHLSPAAVAFTTCGTSTSSPCSPVPKRTNPCVSSSRFDGIVRFRAGTLLGLSMRRVFSRLSERSRLPLAPAAGPRQRLLPPSPHHHPSGQLPRSTHPRTSIFSAARYFASSVTMASDFAFVKEMTSPNYTFPSHRLKRTCEPGRTPLVLVACGSCECLHQGVSTSWR